MNTSHWWVQQLWNLLPPMKPFGKVNDPHDPNRHFTFYAFERNGMETRGLPPEFRESTHGVRSLSLVVHYQKVLEDAYGKLIEQNLPPPATDADGAIRVYLWDVMTEGMGYGPLMHDFQMEKSRRVVPCLILSSRPRGHILSVELERLTAEAVHELRHAFNARQLPQRHELHVRIFSDELKRLLKNWLWLDEALCIMTEADLHRDNFNWTTYMLDWVDACGCPFHADNHKYQSAMFTRYLCRKVSAELLTKTWQHSAEVWTYATRPQTATSLKPHIALSALAEEAAKAGHVLSHPTAQDLFSHGYCFDSYFCHLKELAAGMVNPGYEFEVYERFQGQALTFSSRLKTKVRSEEFFLPALSCHYFRLYPPHDDACTLTLRLTCSFQETDPGNVLELLKNAALRMEAVFVEGEPPVPLLLTRTQATRIGDEWTLSMPGFGATTCDHVIIIVSHAPEIFRSYEPPPEANCKLNISSEA